MTREFRLHALAVRASTQLAAGRAHDAIHTANELLVANAAEPLPHFDDAVCIAHVTLAYAAHADGRHDDCAAQMAVLMQHAPLNAHVRTCRAVLRWTRAWLRGDWRTATAAVNEMHMVRERRIR